MHTHTGAHTDTQQLGLACMCVLVRVLLHADMHRRYREQVQCNVDVRCSQIKEGRKEERMKDERREERTTWLKE